MSSNKLHEQQLFINGRFLTQQTSGVQAFALSICNEILEAIPNTKILVPKNTKTQNNLFVNQLQEIGSLAGHLWEQFDLSRFMKKNPHALLLNLCNTGPVNLTNQVSTIHDLAVIKNPNWFHPAFVIWYKWMLPRLVKNSKNVITVSETIKSELISQFDTLPEKVLVVGNKVPADLLNAEAKVVEEVVSQSKPFFLMVGTHNPRKNFKFIEQFFQDRFPGYVLVIAGGANRNFATGNSIHSSNILRTGFTDNGELKWLYQHATGFINPSLYEGFGIPNLEAMAFDCPVLCSNLAVFKEICDDAAFYFEPGNDRSLIGCFKDVLENKMLRETKTKKGKGIFTQIQSQNRNNTIIKALFE